MKIGIVGLGYVGLPLAIAFCEAGHEDSPLVVDFRGVTRDIPASNLVSL
jgi:UDP-N-acetyl-D-mannosaminuronate dehydrogenase